MTRSIIRATIDQLDLIAPLFDGYRQFYKQPSNVDKARQFIKDRLIRHESVILLALLDEAAASNTRVCAFSTRRLMILAELPNYSSVRRALHGLINKLSIEDYRIAGDLPSLKQATVYLVFSPAEVLARRTAPAQAGLQTGAGYVSDFAFNQMAPALDQAIEHVADFHGLSRREAQVALCCVEGMTNPEIGDRLHISEQTVKYHLRHIFVKYKVKRRTELVLRLLSQSPPPETYRDTGGEPGTK